MRCKKCQRFIKKNKHICPVECSDTYNLTIIERVVDFLINTKRVRVPDRSITDLKQEVRLKCLIALEKYDTTKGAMYSFMVKVAQNHLHNLRRGVWLPNNPPCTRCEGYDKKSKSCIYLSACKRLRIYKHDMHIKASLRVPMGDSTMSQRAYGAIPDTTLEYDAKEAVISQIGLRGYNQLLEKGRCYVRGKLINYKEVKRMLKKS